MRKLTITYDRDDALFELVEETEHGGVETSHCEFGSAALLLGHFLSDDNLTVPTQIGVLMGSVMDGRLTSITSGGTMISATEALRRIHAHLVSPYEWDSGTIEGVAEILSDAGYQMPDEPLDEEDDGVLVNDPRLDPYRPPKHPDWMAT